MIEVKNLKKTFQGAKGLLGGDIVKALRGVSLTLEPGGAIALIGESGCGKTTLGRIVTGLETYDGGDLIINGVNVSTLRAGARAGHFRQVQLIPQDPYSALNPSRTIASALFDPLRIHAKKTGRDKQWIQSRAEELLQLVGLSPQDTLYKYPHQLSGGQRQRVVVARALTVEPKVLIADESVSMIDVSLRLGILNLLQGLRERLGIAIIFITHDVAAGRYVAQDGKIVVIYKGEIVEEGVTDDLILNPVHPYTQALLSAAPVLHGLEQPGVDRSIPAPEAAKKSEETGGCLFATRCPFADEHCHTAHPELQFVPEVGRRAACFKPQVRHVVATALTEAQAN